MTISESLARLRNEVERTEPAARTGCDECDRFVNDLRAAFAYIDALERIASAAHLYVHAQTMSGQIGAGKMLRDAVSSMPQRANP